MCSSLLILMKIPGNQGPGTRTPISTLYYQTSYRIILHWNKKLAEAQVVAGGLLWEKDPGGRETEPAGSCIVAVL